MSTGGCLIMILTDGIMAPGLAGSTLVIISKLLSNFIRTVGSLFMMMIADDFIATIAHFIHDDDCR